MGLPGGKDINIAGHRQNIVGHAGAEALNVPFFRAMKTELAIEPVRPDLGWHLKEQHSRKATTMRVDRIVVALSLHIEPQINHSQAVPSRSPRPPSLGWLPVDHMTDPPFTSRQDHGTTEFSNRWVSGRKFPLIGELSSQFCGCVRRAAQIRENFFPRV